MMQRCSNIVRIALFLAIAGSFSAPVSAAAFSLPALPTPRLQDVGAAVLNTQSICLRLGSLESSVASRIEASNAAYEKDALAREARTIAMLASKDAALSARSSSDAKLAAYIQTLNTKANGDVLKKQAIAAFTAEVRAATETRRKTVDAAARIYRDGVAEVSRQRVKEVKALGGNLRADLLKATASATTRCRSGADATSVRGELTSTLAEIERTYRGKLADKSAFLSQLSVLANTRTSAISDADAAFSASLDASSQRLRAVLQ